MDSNEKIPANIPDSGLSDADQPNDSWDTIDSVADMNAVGGGMPIPPADFTFLIYSLSTQAQLQLGLLRLDENSTPEPNIPIARHTIDLLAMLQQKTQGNLSLSEKLLLENTLTDLRFRFVQVSQQAAK